jgi:hypothetical protein
VKQEAFVKAYEDLLKQLSADKAVVFTDAVHPTHAVRPVGCGALKETHVAVEQSSGRNRLNIHDAIDLETGHTIIMDVPTVNALSTIMLLMAIETPYPAMRSIHVVLDNFRYHHAKLVQAWLHRTGCRIEVHFAPSRACSGHPRTHRRSVDGLARFRGATRPSAKIIFAKRHNLY